jgi:hypothetical protein
MLACWRALGAGSKEARGRSAGLARWTAGARSAGPDPIPVRSSGPAGWRRCRPGLLSRPGLHVPAKASLFRPSWLICRTGHNMTMLALQYAGPACCLLPFKYFCTHNLTYRIYISHNKGVLWYTWGYIPDTKGPARPANMSSNHEQFLVK